MSINELGLNYLYLADSNNFRTIMTRLFVDSKTKCEKIIVKIL